MIKHHKIEEAKKIKAAAMEIGITLEEKYCEGPVNYDRINKRYLPSPGSYVLWVRVEDARTGNSAMEYIESAASIKAALAKAKKDLKAARQNTRGLIAAEKSCNAE